MLPTSKDATDQVLGPRMVDSILVLDGVEEFERRDVRDSEPLRGPDGKGVVLDGLGHVNLFVGANNSGKSRFMRALLRQEWWIGAERWEGTSREGWETLGQIRDLTSGREIDGLTPDQRDGMKALVQSLRVDGRSGEVRAWVRSGQEWGATGHIWPAGINNEQNKKSLRNALQKRAVEQSRSYGHIEPYLGSWMHELQALRTNGTRLNKFSVDKEARYYFPIPRGLRPLYSGATTSVGGWDYTDWYGQYIKKVYGAPNGVELLGVTSGMEIYHEIRSLVLGGTSDRKLLADYEDFLSAAFFDCKQIALVPHESRPNQKGDPSQGILHIEIGDIPSMPIYHLGDGLQQLILLTFYAFQAKARNEPSIIFIEEPELYLHPGMQRRLIDWYLNETPHLYFMTTHSNHLLDMSMDWPRLAVFNFSGSQPAEGKQQFTIRQVDRGDQSSLALLGVRASSVFLVNATIWVEGPTDRKYLRAYVALLEAAFSPPQLMKEDTHFAFVEYGGALIDQYDFGSDESNENRIAVKPISDGAFVLVDNDGDNAKTARKDRLKCMLSGGERFGITAGREIENMLPPSVLLTAIKERGSIEGDPPKVEQVDYSKELIGGWIDTYLNTNRLKSRVRFASKEDGTGTLAGHVKGTFCDTACEHLRNANWADLSPDVQTLLLRIYNHIRDMNGLPPLTDPASPSTP